jgi:predicted unusual protein kinase regulating ubiquinone biosynthesis (AarF/ABC1/UbiB family)
LADLGPVFSAFGLYLSTRGDLLAPADRRFLAEIGQNISPMSPSAVRAIVSTESGKLRVSAGPSPISEAAIASLDAEPFDTRLLIQRHYGRLSSGRAVVVRVVRTERAHESDVELIPLLRSAVTPLLNDRGLFAQSVDDFRASYAAQTNGHALADALEILGHDARGHDSLRIPKVYRSISTPRVLIMERLPGHRLRIPLVKGGHSSVTRGENVHEDDDAFMARGGGSAPARLICELWLRQAFDGGLVPTDVCPENLIVVSRSQVAVDEGTFAVLPHETRQNILKYLVAVAIDEPRKALDYLLKEFEATRHRTPVDQLDRLFRQMIPDTAQDDLSDGPTARLVSSVQSQWRLAIENGYRPLRHGLPLLRGLVKLDETVRGLAPGTDAFLEGLKDYRLTRLLGDIHAMCEPMYWFGRLDKIVTLMMSSPRILDDAIASAVPDRAAEERRAPNRRIRHTRAGVWVLPSLAALIAIGVTFCRAPPTTAGLWGEAPVAIVFLILGYWMLRNAVDSDR